MSDWDYQKPRLAVAKVLLPILACLVAILLPLTLVIRLPHVGDEQGYFVMGLVLAGSRYWGVRARRDGSRIAFRLITVLPLALLGLSIVASTALALAGVLLHP